MMYILALRRGIVLVLFANHQLYHVFPAGMALLQRDLGLSFSILKATHFVPNVAQRLLREKRQQ